MGCGGRDHPAPAACVHAGGRRRARCRARSRDAVQPSSNFASQLPSLFRAFSLPFKSKIFQYLYYATEQNYDLSPQDYEYNRFLRKVSSSRYRRHIRATAGLTDYPRLLFFVSLLPEVRTVPLDLVLHHSMPDAASYVCSDRLGDDTMPFSCNIIDSIMRCHRCVCVVEAGTPRPE